MDETRRYRVLADGYIAALFAVWDEEREHGGCASDETRHKATIAKNLLRAYRDSQREADRKGTP